MHDNQLKIMFVGESNNRTDYHIQVGEEIFIMLYGDMILKVVELGVHRDIIIREGEILFLPPNIPHSPKRFPNTIGLVIERMRKPNELDTMRWYAHDLTFLYEEQFHCNNIETQLASLKRNQPKGDNQ